MSGHVLVSNMAYAIGEFTPTRSFQYSNLEFRMNANLLQIRTTDGKSYSDTLLDITGKQVPGIAGPVQRVTLTPTYQNFFAPVFDLNFITSIWEGNIIFSDNTWFHFWISTKSVAPNQVVVIRIKEHVP